MAAERLDDGQTGLDPVSLGWPWPATTRRSRGRESFRTQAWADAYACLAAADRRSPLEPDDLKRLAVSAYLACGRDDRAPSLGDRQRCWSSQASTCAARTVFWLAFS